MLASSQIEEGKNFLQALQDTVDRKGNSTFATWYDKHGKPELKYTFNELWNEAGYIAHDLLANHHLSKGDRVILCYNFGLQFFAAFLGCLRAGVVAVLIYPPSPSNMTKSLDKMNKVIDDSKPKLVMIDSTINLLRINPLAKTRHLWPKDVTWKVHPKMAKNMKRYDGMGFNTQNPQSSFLDNENSMILEDMAFMQYTSGSTGDPKGVMVSFRSLHANIKAIHDGAQPQLEKQGIKPDEIMGFSWLPQYHDMGLVYAVIAPFAGGWKCNMISPITFVQNPLLWIELMSKLRVNWTVAPNFAFRLTARKFMEAKARTHREPIPNLDLTSLKYMQNSAEPIQTDTKAMFEQAFKQYGLNDDWFVGAYGLAESVVGVTFLFEYKMSTYTPNGSTSLVAVGHKSCFPKGQTIKIIDTNTLTQVQEKEVGELWLSGRSVTSGYFGRPQLTQEVFHAKLSNDEKQYLRTGDLAFMEDGYLYICGRLKDIIIVNGVNYYPQDIEHAVENASSGVRPGCVAAFSSDDVGTDGDLEIVFEVRNSHESSVHEVTAEVCDTVMKSVGIVPSKVVAIKERTICKTTSGKIQRKATRTAFHSGHFDVIYIHTGHTPLKNRKTTHTATSSSIDSNLEEESTDAFDRIIYSYFGTNINFDQSWDDLGMSSMMSVQLRDAFSYAFPVALSPDAFELYPSPADLKAFIHGSKGVPIISELRDIPEIESSRISWFWLGLLQLLGGLMLLLMFSFGIVPAYYTGKLFMHLDIYVNIPTIEAPLSVDWIWIPIIIPVWMLSFSVCVILMKWILIGKYKEGKLQVQSLAYVQWWLVDRAVALWEAWVGKFMLDTPLLNAFYIALGAKINIRAPIDAFIREFDLVTIEGFSSISHPINCRKFSTWTEEEGPSLRFRPILIGNACKIKGMVSPGSSTGDGSYVESLSVVPEGGQVPELSEVVGNPAFITGKSTPYKDEINEFVLGILKVMWLVCELYLFFATVLLGQYLWVPHLPQWRYSSLLMWCLLILWFAYASIATSVLLKWILVGRRKPGKINHSLWKEISHWAADWHFVNSLELIEITAFGGTIWNIILKLHGMDIDMTTRLATPEWIPPSKVDLVKMKESFMSTCIFDVEDNDFLYQINIEKSSIGYGCKIATNNDHLRIANASISPYSKINKNIDGSDRRAPIFGFTQSLWINAKIAFLHLSIVMGGILCSLIPSYEIWNLCWKPKSISLAVPLLMIGLIMQVMALAAIVRILQPFALMTKTNSSEASNKFLFLSCMRLSHFLKLTAVPMLAFRGSSVYNALLAFLGVQIKGRVIVMDQALYEYQYLTIEDETIIDASHISGHHVEFDQVTLGHSSIRGIVNQGTYCPCTNITGPETDPWRAYIGAQATRSSKKKDIFSDNGLIENVPSNRGAENFQSEQKMHDIENPIINEGDVLFETNPVADLRSSVNSDYYDYGYSESDDSNKDEDCSYSSSIVSC
ncbi:hypothetical protein CTEN210_17552 [Chaetoceros tenuissimus]|uniref:Carrier domain-containing protein n=1 Tax=Chaetoceros tenuissimus TaxID=426638 RepID=A0AAD3DAX8_9STRA|nr:hypothetical protein CTEN210_17552 [Chaetoceros tenuissimus]